MKLYAKITSERASKGQGGNDYIDIDLHDDKQVHIGRLVFMVNANDKSKYILVEDAFFRSPKLTIKAYEKPSEALKDLTMLEIPLRRITKGKSQKGEVYCSECFKATLGNNTLMKKCSKCKN